MQVAANLKGGLLDLNLPHFGLYANNLEVMSAWTRERMRFRVSESLRSGN